MFVIDYIASKVTFECRIMTIGYKTPNLGWALDVNFYPVDILVLKEVLPKNA